VYGGIIIVGYQFYMPIKHSRKYYVGGLFSLIILPILFLISTTEVRKRAISYASIEVDVPPVGDVPIAEDIPESVFLFHGSGEAEKLLDLQQFCQTIKLRPKTIYELELPEKCSYGFFVQVIDLLRRNNCDCGANERIIKFDYRPDQVFQQEYEPLTIDEECQFISSELSTWVDSIKTFVGGNPIPEVRIRKYTGLGPPPTMLGLFRFSYVDSRIKQEPRSAFLFRSIGLWFVPIIVLWVLLLFLSIKNANCCLSPS
jgi:hypothetical protein